MYVIFIKLSKYFLRYKTTEKLTVYRDSEDSSICWAYDKHTSKNRIRKVKKKEAWNEEEVDRITDQKYRAWIWILASRWYMLRLIVESSFNINLLTQLEYSISIFWLNLNTWFQHSDSIWYWSWVDTWFEFSTRIIKKSKMTSNVKIYYFWIYYIIIFERLTWNKWIYFSSRCLHYLVALSIKYIARCLILIRHMNCQDFQSRKSLISWSFIHLLSIVFILMNLQVKIHETSIMFSLKRNKLFKKRWIEFIMILLF